ncbi:MAG: hypothetical protein COB73_08455 [Flavobacteriaceae bacterium]|nr:MAG: hypothetical protein COB73_08455 [Flavobacteriaceae bacterium]
MNAALNNQDITVYGDGSQTRTFCFVENNIKACVTAAFSNDGKNRTINIGNNIETSILDLAQLIIKLTDSKSEIKHLPPLEDGDMTRRNPDITIMKELLNEELISLEEGLKKVLQNTSFIV